MNKKLTLFLVLLFSYSIPLLAIYNDETFFSNSSEDLGSIIQIAQNVNEKGAVEIKGNFYKPLTSSDIKLSIFYKNENGAWSEIWCKNFLANKIFNENLVSRFELPASKSAYYDVKLVVSSSDNTSNLNEIYWNKEIKHYKQGDYKVSFIPKPKVEINPKNYSVLLTPNTANTIKYDANGKIIALEDRAKTVPYSEKYYNELSLINSNSELKNDGKNNYISIKRKDDDNSNGFVTTTKDYIYKGSETSQYVYPYHDPVFVYAGKFPSEGFYIFYARYGSEESGSADYNFLDPNNLHGRIFNLFNVYDQKLNDLFKPGEPIVIVASHLTGTRIYKKDGTFSYLTGHSNYDKTSAYSGFGDVVYPNGTSEKRGPGNERFYLKINKGSEFSFYGMGTIANFPRWGQERPIADVEKDIKSFIDYTGIFDDSSNANCGENIEITINDDANSDIADKDWKSSPNSYIYDLNLVKSNNYGGLYIPINKAYDVWGDKNGFINQKIPDGRLSASIIWQDKEKLIDSLSLIGTGKEAKIKVGINSSKGKGNAVIALHIGNNGNNTDPIYWSWHVWITDDPTLNSVTYTNNADSRMTNTFMDRNLGALADDFFGEDWNKSAGLMYQWGRKDPFPTMRYIDETLLKYYINSGEEVNNNNFSIKILKSRPSDIISDNIKYTIQNPLYFLNSKESAGAWFASRENNIELRGNDGYAIKNYDLWGDNNEGRTKETSFEQKHKTEYDPCPAGWRVPSFAHSDSTIPNFSPWGSGFNYNSGDNPNYSITESNNRYPNAKFYTRMGVDFENGSDNYNIGKYPLTGGYKRYNDSGNVHYQDNLSESNIWSATLQGNAQGRNFHIINDPDQHSGSPYLINTSQEGPTVTGAAVRCVKDLVTTKIFKTEYFVSDNRNYEDGIDNPNSYVLYGKKDIDIPVNKAYAVFNQVLTDKKWIPNGKQTANVYWTTNKNLIKSLDIIGNDENAKINIKLNDNQFGNVVVSLHIGNKGNSEDLIYWSWHIWVPKTDPENETITYLSESSSTSSTFKVYSTKLGFPPMKTEFMNRPLGALESYNSSQGTQISSDTYGMFYQWGRKDPIPGFYTVSWGTPYPIYKGTKTIDKIQYTTISDNNVYVNLGYQKENLQNNLSPIEMISYSVQNPLAYLYNTNNGNADWMSNISQNEDIWGHASKKSIYDPCPEGWRVPDYGFKLAVNSPWVKGSLATINNKLEVFLSEKFSDYKGNKIYVRTGYKIPKAFTFYDSEYRVGYLPASGNRRYLAKSGANLYDNIYAASFWSGTKLGDYRGYAFGLDTYDEYYIASNVVSPSQARNVVCSKDTPRFSKEYFKNLFLNKKKNTLSDYKESFSDSVTFNIYPNPVNDILNINGNSNEDYFYQIYDLTGKVISKGKFINNKINVSQLKAGIYLIRINDSKEVTKIIKK